MVAGKKETRREGEVTEHTLHNADENIPKKKRRKKQLKYYNCRDLCGGKYVRHGTLCLIGSLSPCLKPPSRRIFQTFHEFP